MSKKEAVHIISPPTGIEWYLPFEKLRLVDLIDQVLDLLDRSRLPLPPGWPDITLDDYLQVVPTRSAP